MYDLLPLKIQFSWRLDKFFQICIKTKKRSNFFANKIIFYIWLSSLDSHSSFLLKKFLFNNFLERFIKFTSLCLFIKRLQCCILFHKLLNFTLQKMYHISIETNQIKLEVLCFIRHIYLFHQFSCLQYVDLSVGFGLL